MVNCIYHLFHQPEEYGTRLFKVGPGAGLQPTRARHFAKNTSGPVSIPLNNGASGLQANNLTLTKRVKAWGNGSLRQEGWGTPDRAEQLTIRPTEVWPNNWRGAPDTGFWSTPSDAPLTCMYGGERIHYVESTKSNIFEKRMVGTYSNYLYYFEGRYGERTLVIFSRKLLLLDTFLPLCFCIGALNIKTSCEFIFHFIFGILLRRSPEIFIWKEIIVPRRGVNIFTIAFAMLRGAALIKKLLGVDGCCF